MFHLRNDRQIRRFRHLRVQLGPLALDAFERSGPTPFPRGPIVIFTDVVSVNEQRQRDDQSQRRPYNGAEDGRSHHLRTR